MTRKNVILLTGTLGLLSIAYATISFPKPSTNIADSTVMITNLDSTSGGSGSILSSHPNHSEILTNSHVCEVVVNGGVVKTRTGSHLVYSYKQSKVHDLCLITVIKDLKVNTPVALSEPTFGEPSTVSGHPHLLPNIVTTGHFSDHTLIKIMTGIRECTEEEALDETLSLFCFLLGGLPIVKTYDTVVTSATIQPGSSGSSIYNSSGEVSAVVFAGSGDLSYGFAVPHEYIINFLQKELPKLRGKIPDMTLQFKKVSKKTQQSEYKKKASKLCKELTKLNDKLDVCGIINKTDLIFGE